VFDELTVADWNRSELLCTFTGEARSHYDRKRLVLKRLGGCSRRISDRLSILGAILR
jgi:hypothetical protein